MVKGFKIREFADRNYRAIFNDKTGQTLRIALDTSKPIQSLEYPELLDISFGTKCLANCWFCLTGDSLINTPSGEKRIDEISIDDEVYCINDECAPLISKVGQLHVREYSGELITITLDDDTVLKLTPNHKVNTNRGFIEAGKLLNSDIIVSM